MSARAWLGLGLIGIAVLVVGVVVGLFFGGDAGRDLRAPLSYAWGLLFGGSIEAQDVLFVPTDEDGKLQPSTPQSVLEHYEALYADYVQVSGRRTNFQHVVTMAPDSSIVRLSRGVARLDLKLKGGKKAAVCTAFLVSDEYALTAGHCFYRKGSCSGSKPRAKADRLALASATLVFGYYGREQFGTTDSEANVEAKPEPVKGELHCENDLDYALLEVDPKSLKDARSRPPPAVPAVIHPVFIGDVKISSNHQLLILHHPDGRAQMATERHCLAARKPDRHNGYFAHYCDTLRGSSGAPVFSRDHEVVVGLHLRSQIDPGPAGEENAALRISEIVAKSPTLAQLNVMRKNPPTAEQRELIDYANQRGEESALLRANGRTTLAAYVAMSGLQRFADRPKKEWAYLMEQAAGARLHLARALYVMRESASLKHPSAVKEVQLSPDGSVLLAFLPAGQPTQAPLPAAQLWNVATRQPIATLDWPRGAMSEQAGFSPDSRRLVTWTSNDRAAYLWDARTGERKAQLPLHRAGLDRALFSPDSRRLVTWFQTERSFNLWDAKTGRKLARLAWQGGEALAFASDPASYPIAFSGDGEQIVSAAPGDTVARLWSANDGRLLAELPLGRGRYVLRAAFSPNGRRLLMWGTGKVALLLNPKSPGREPIGQLKLDEQIGELTNVVFSRKDGAQFVTWGPSDPSARLWNADGALLLKLPGHAPRVEGAAFSPDGKRLLTWVEGRVWSASDGPAYAPKARLWNTEELRLERELEEPTCCGAFSPDSTALVTWSNQTRSHVLWRAATGMRVAPLAGGMPTGTGGDPGVRFHRDSSEVVTWPTGAAAARLWDAGTGQRLAELGGHGWTLLGAEYVGGGTEIATWAFGDSHVRLWDARQQALAEELEGHKDRATALFSPAGDRLVTWAPEDATVRVWRTTATPRKDRTTPGRNPTMATLEAEIKEHNGQTAAPLFNPSPRHPQLLIWGRNDKAFRLWTLAGDKPAMRLLSHGERVSGAEFSPDGSQLVTWSTRERHVRLWNTSTGAVAKLDAVKNPIAKAKFGPDGKQLAFWGEGDDAVQLWSARGVRRLEGHPGGVADVWFSPSLHGDVLIATTAKGPPFRVPPFDTPLRTLPSIKFRSTVRLWSASTAAPAGELAWDSVWNGPYVSIAIQVRFSPNGRRIFSWGHNDKKPRLWDVAGKRPVVVAEPELTPDKSAMESLRYWDASFSPDGERIVAWRSEFPSSASLLDGNDGSLKSGLGGVYRAQFRPGGAQLMTYSTGANASVTLWDAKSGQFQRRIERPKGDWVHGAAYSSKGAWLAIWATGEGAVTIWNPDTGALAAEFGVNLLLDDGNLSRASHVVFSPDEKTLVIDGSDGGNRVSLWSILGEGACLIDFTRWRLREVHPAVADCDRYALLNCKLPPPSPESCQATPN